jgi:mannose-6-phosphate isomerase-like protein (cupin superfamily)
MTSTRCAPGRTAPTWSSSASPTSRPASTGSPCGGTDPQQPHAEDEVYYVLAGRARVRVGDEDESVAPGTFVYVPKEVEHRFHDIEDDLTLLVFFAPAETEA